MRIEIRRDYTVFHAMCEPVITSYNVIRAVIRTEFGVQICVQARGWRDFIIIFENGLCYSMDQIGHMMAEIKRAGAEVSDTPIVMHRDPPTFNPGDYERTPT